MSLSRKLIKFNYVDISPDSLEIPLTPIKGKNENWSLANDNDEEQAYIKELSERASQIQAKMDELIRQSEEQAKQIIQNAKEQAQAIKELAKEAGYQDGFEKGKQDGYSTGYEEAVEKTREMQEQAKALLMNAHRESREYIKKTKEDIIQLAASMAKNIIQCYIDLNDQSIVEMVKSALQHAEEKKQVLFRCPAQFVPVLQANTYQFEKVCPNAAFVVLEDNTINSPGCIIETEDQVINLEIDKQLDNMVQALQEMEIQDEH